MLREELEPAHGRRKSKEPFYRHWKGQARRAYYDALWAQFRSLPEPIAHDHPAHVEKIHKLFEHTDRHQARWRDLAAIEQLLAQLDTDATAADRAKLIRQCLRYFLSPEDFASLVESHSPGTNGNGSVVDQRLQLRTLISLLHFQFDLRLKRNALRDMLGFWSIVFAAGFLVIGLCFAHRDYQDASRPETVARQLPAGTKTPNQAGAADKAPEKAPSDLLTAAGGGQVTLVWNDQTGNEEGFRIERKVGEEPWAVLDRIPGDTVRYVDTDVTAGNRYSYRVQAVNAKGMSLASNASTAMLRVSGTREAFPVFHFVLLMGALGGFVGMQRRLQQSPAEGHLLSSTMDLESGKLTAGAAPLFGAVFALLMYLVFAAGFLEGEFFPKIYPVAASTPFLPRTGVTSMGEFLLLSHPVSPIDVAKLLVWSFVAGFAERLVPDTLDRIANRADSLPAPRPARAPASGGGAAPGEKPGAVPTPAEAKAATAQLPENEPAATPTGSALILEINPSAGASVPPNVTPVIRFAVPMQDADLMLLQVGEEPVELARTPSEDRLTLTLQPRQPLEPGAYELRVSILFPVDQPEVASETTVPFTVVAATG